MQRIDKKAGLLLDSLLRVWVSLVESTVYHGRTSVDPSRPEVCGVIPNHTLAETGLWRRSRVYPGLFTFKDAAAFRSFSIS